MSATLYLDIRSALTARLKTLAASPEVAWEGVTYLPVVGRPYLRPEVLWAEGSQAELGENGLNWERGIYQVACNFPPNQGRGPVLDMAGKIREHFKRGTALQYNGLTVKIRKVYLSPAMETDDGVIIVVSAPFYCQAPN